MASMRVDRNVLRLPNEPEEFFGMTVNEGTVQLVIYAGNVRVYVGLSSEEAFGLGLNLIRAGETARLQAGIVQPAAAPLIVAEGKH